MTSSLFTDASIGTGLGAAAAWVRMPSGLRKILVLLPHLKPQEGELVAGLMGVALWRVSGGGGSLTWNLDNPHLVARLKASVNEPLFALLQRNLEGVQVVHVPAHSGVSANEACDKACRWGVQKGLLLLGEARSRFVGQGPEHWLLFDARSCLKDWGGYLALTEEICRESFAPVTP